MVSPGFLDGNKTTMATTPVPNKIRTSDPRNSAINSAVSEGFRFIRISARLAFSGREVVYQAARVVAVFSWIASAGPVAGVRPPEVNARRHFPLTFGLPSVRYRN